MKDKINLCKWKGKH